MRGGDRKVPANVCMMNQHPNGRFIIGNKAQCVRVLGTNNDGDTASSAVQQHLPLHPSRLVVRVACEVTSPRRGQTAKYRQFPQ
eukprot:5283495-Pyramimonas_sp.AAC.1